MKHWVVQGNLIPLALSNTFHVGEIISISRVEFQPADDPADDSDLDLDLLRFDVVLLSLLDLLL